MSDHASPPGTDLSVGSRFRADRARYPRNAWTTERALWAVATYRLGQWLDGRLVTLRFRLLARILRLPYQCLAAVVQGFTGVELLPRTPVGPGLRIHHGDNLVVNADAIIGADCVLRQGVTIGHLQHGGGAPVIGDRVEFGAYAQVLGNVKVGDDAKIGAMTLVLEDVPAGATAVGVPARIIPRATDRSAS